MALLPHEILVKSVGVRLPLLGTVTVAKDAIADLPRFERDMQHLGATVRLNKETDQFEVSQAEQNHDSKEESS